MKPNYKSIPIVAIRSLQSEHHAKHLPPTIFAVTWNLGKKCNYDCSYCSPQIHDLHSAFPNINDIKNFMTNVSEQLKKNNKSIRFNFTGGEPFLHPEIIDIFKHAFELTNHSGQMVAVTNGSLPLELYQESMNYLSNLTISIHLERSQKETNKTVNKIIALHKQFGSAINVNLTCVAGEMHLWKFYSDQLTKNNVKHVLRRVRPNFDENKNIFKPHMSRRDNSLAKLPMIIQKLNKIEYKAQRTKLLSSLYEQYYTAEELAWLSENVSDVWWQNIGIWYEDGTYQEANTDDLLTLNRTGFRDWICWVGIDGVMVDFDGTVYLGTCANNGEIGHITKSFQLPTSPTQCTKEVCISNPDVNTRKCKSLYQHLLT